MVEYFYTLGAPGKSRSYGVAFLCISSFFLGVSAGTYLWNFIRSKMTDSDYYLSSV